MTLIDHETHACLLIAKVTPDHAGLWTCEVGSFCHTHAFLVISSGESEKTAPIAFSRTLHIAAR